VVRSKQPRHETIRALYGTLYDDAAALDQYKPDGLMMKKTISVKWNGTVYRVVSFYDPAEVLAHRLTRPVIGPYLTELVLRNGGLPQFK